MADLNVVMLHGRLTSNPETRVTQDGKTVARFSVAVNGFKENHADFIRCVAFDKKAEVINNYFKKGSQILINGRIQTGSYDDKDGKKVYTTDVFVNDFDFCDKKSDTPEAPVSDDGFIDVSDSDESELPF